VEFCCFASALTVTLCAPGVMFEVVERLIIAGFPATLFVKLAVVPRKVEGFLILSTADWKVLSFAEKLFQAVIWLLFVVCLF
jgi:hypothetical protein